MSKRNSICFETIGPKKAKEYLETLDDRQRQLNPHSIARLASDLTGGNWKLVPDCIHFIDDRLVNGQHRLNAVVQCTMPMCVGVLRTYGNSDAFAAIDGIVPRSIAFELQHAYGYKNANCAVAIGKLVMAYEAMVEGTSDNFHTSSLTDKGRMNMIKLMAKRMDEFASVTKEARSIYLASPLIPAPALGAAILICRTCGKPPEPAKWFERVVKAQELRQGTPEYLLHGRVAKARTGLGARRISAENFVPVMLRAWIAARDGEELGKLYNPLQCPIV
jgi:hypothetical protein